ncbi:MAG: hypothetical protein MUO72_17740 [Bacteroidales bacterium]|nr:hypothetical protein [Bacteroidales bacterium]
MKDKENIYKNRIFSVTSEIGQGQLPHRATVLESYGFVCLVKVQKAYISGGFSEYGIYRIMLDANGVEILQSMMINYETTQGLPSRYGAPEAEVKAKFDKIKGQMQLADSEAEVAKDRKIKEDQARQEVEKVKIENFTFIKSELNEINIKLKELIKDQPAKKSFNDKTIRGLITDLYTLEQIRLQLIKK